MAKRPSPDTTWGPEGCGDARPKKLLMLLAIVLLALLLAPFAYWRDNE